MILTAQASAGLWALAIYSILNRNKNLQLTSFVPYLYRF